MVNHQVICMGATSSGKTTLLNILENKKSNATVEGSQRVLIKTLPTVGINHFYINRDIIRNKSAVELKEYGGQLAPLWTTYLRQQRSKNILYLVDCADLAKLPETSIHLVEVLEQIAKCPSRLLLVYTKIDLLTPDGSDFFGDCVPFENKRLSEYRQLLRIHHLKTFCPSVDICEVAFSAINGQGLPFISHWLQKLGP